MSRVNLPGPKSKTPSVQTLGVLLFGLISNCFSINATADCVPKGMGETAIIDHIYDGDTVKLTDGRRVRILGVNTPEVAHGHKQSGEALGEEARRATETFFKTNKHARIFYDVQRVDRHGRTLAHLYDARGNSLSAHLLRKGLGFHVAIPPNLSLKGCLHAQETIARNKSLGVWGNSHWKPIPASQLTLGQTGFKRVTGRVTNVHKAQSIWLELDGPIAIKITQTDLKNFSVRDWRSLKGRRVEVRGWITGRPNDNDSGKANKSTSLPQKSHKPLIMQPRIAENLSLLHH